MLKTEQDFYDLMYAYLKRAAGNNVWVAEIFFDPQTHTERGVPFDTVINGLHRALVDGYQHFGLKGSLIMCFLRHLSEEEAFKVLDQAIPHLNKIVAVGLDSGEKGNPPTKFKHVYEKAHSLGLKLVAHAGEEGGPDYIWEALEELHVARIDHGVQCLKDEKLVKKLVLEQIPLTVCPLSNQKLKVNERFFDGANVTKQLLDEGLMVTINSDDPAYFGGYITRNFRETAIQTGMTEKDVFKVCCNAFNATFLPLVEKEFLLTKLRRFNVISGHAAPPRSVTIFGSRRPKPGSPEYKLAYEIGNFFASHGFQVVCGGYSGTMTGICQGACDCQGRAVGVLAPTVFYDNSLEGNEYLRDNPNGAVMYTHDISERITKLMESSEYFIVLPGTVGTITELTVVWTIASVRKINNYPVPKIFAFRQPLEKVVVDLKKTTDIPQSDLDLVTFFDEPNAVLEIIEADLKERSPKEN